MPQKKKPKRKQSHLHPWARIDRPAAAHEARVQLGAAIDLLDMDADFGLAMLQEAVAIREETRPFVTSLAALLLFHRATELVDTISVLVRAGCATPLPSLMRGQLEALMYARYLMTVNDERVAGAFIVSQELAWIARFEQNAEGHVPGSAPTLLAKEAKNVIEGAMGEDRIFRESRAELARLSLASSVPAPWYQAFGGPRTLGGMSKRLDDTFTEKVFAVLYDPWSANIHANDTMNAFNGAPERISPTENLLKPLRTPSRLDLVRSVRTCHDMFLTMVTHHMLYFRFVPKGLDKVQEFEERVRPLLDD